MIKNHIKIAWRNLTKRKGFTLINVLGLSLGFACSILIFLFVQYHLRFDNFHFNGDRIYRFDTEQHMDDVSYVPSVPPGFADAFKQDFDYAESVAKIADWGESQITVDGKGSELQLLETTAFAEPDFFKIFNYPLLRGSGFDVLSEPNTALITEKAAQKLFGSADPLNRTFVLENKETFTVKGVLKNLPENTMFNQQLFLSYPTLKAYSQFMAGQFWGGISSNLQVFGLLRPHQDIATIEKSLEGYVPKYRPNSKNVHTYRLQALSDIHFNPKYGGMDPKLLWIFSCIGLFILVMACINFINIATAQATNRSKEVGVLKVLGGRKEQLFWQFLIETFLVALFALVLGGFLCMLALPAFNSVFEIQLSLTGLFTIKFLGFALVLLVLVSLLAGSYPGILLSRITPILALKGKVSQGDAGGYMTRKALVVIQFSISIALIVGAIVVGKQLRYAINSDLGFKRDGIVMVPMASSLDRVPLRALKERLESSPYIHNVSACYTSPGAPITDWGTSLTYDNNPEPVEFNVQVKDADMEYLRVFGLSLVAGKNFVEKDTVDEALVNMTLVHKLGFTDPQEVLNKDINVGVGHAQAKIVGVLEDFHDQDFHAAIDPIVIAPVPSNYNELALTIDMSQAKQALADIEREWKGVYPDYMFDYSFLDDRVAKLYTQEQQFLSLIGVFSGLAIFIGCLGIYGLILFFVIQKTKEIGIRKVLGGSLAHLVGLLVNDFFKLILVAAAIAVPVAWYFMQGWLENFQYRTPLSWWIFVLAIASVMVITLTTIGYQAIKAALANPVKSLRTE